MPYKKDTGFAKKPNLHPIAYRFCHQHTGYKKRIERFLLARWPSLELSHDFHAFKKNIPEIGEEEGEIIADACVEVISSYKQELLRNNEVMIGRTAEELTQTLRELVANRLEKIEEKKDRQKASKPVKEKKHEIEPNIHDVIALAHQSKQDSFLEWFSKIRPDNQKSILNFLAALSDKNWNKNKKIKRIKNTNNKGKKNLFRYGTKSKTEPLRVVFHSTKASTKILSFGHRRDLHQLVKKAADLVE